MMLDTEEEFDSAFSGSDLIASPFIRPRNPDMHSSVRLKLSAAKLFSANNFDILISPDCSETTAGRLSRVSSRSDDSTFIVETRSLTRPEPIPVKTYL